jgi:Lrp/AsnC family leucine-responsive transcriptional regulator
MALDATDLKILEILQADGKASHAAIAEKVGIKAPSVFERIKKLEGRGIIQGYTVLIDPAALDKNLTAFIGVTIMGGPDYADESAIVDKIANEPAIEECHIVAGEESFILKVRVRTPQELQDLTTRLRRIEGVARTRTTVALSTPLDRPGPSISD